MKTFKAADLFFALLIAALFPLSAMAQSRGWDRQEVSTATQADAWFENYRFRDGETLARLRIHYATLGTAHRNAEGDIDNAVLVLHWTGADGRALMTPAYIKALFDPGRPLDAQRYYLIFADSVGHGQSSKPSDGLKAHFPNYGYNDIVDLQHKLITETLGIKHLHAILGMSMGGMNAWQWAEAYPDAMDGVMAVVSLPIKVSGRNMLWRRMVIDGIRSDPDWNDGNYTKPPAGWLKSYSILRMMIDGVPHFQAIVPDQQTADAFIENTHKVAAGVDANPQPIMTRNPALLRSRPKSSRSISTMTSSIPNSSTCSNALCRKSRTGASSFSMAQRPLSAI